MRTRLVVIVAVGLMLAAEKADDAVKKDLEKFSGEWNAVSITHDGKKASEEEAKKFSLVVKGEKYTYKMGKTVIEGTHKIDPAKKPKTIDATRTKGPEAGETLKGIYELEGDTLKVCFGAAGKDRPKEFTAEAGSGRRLIVMKRAKP